MVEIRRSMRLVVMSTKGNAYQHEVNSIVGDTDNTTFNDVNGDRLIVTSENECLYMLDYTHKKKYKILRWWVE